MNVYNFLMLLIVAATMKSVKCWSIENQSPLLYNLPPPIPVNCSEDATYCENVEYYPEDLIAWAVGTKYREFFQQSERVSEPPLRNESDVLVCDGKKLTVYPKAVKDEERNWQYLVNTVYHRQPIEVNKCREEDFSYCKAQNNLPPGYTIKCVNRTFKQKMVVIRDGQPFTGSFSFPHDCKCYILKSDTGDEPDPNNSTTD
ncbi:protein spaetzle-like [Limulus polyphemus]|uniref:Protein spaetzle-like n=1 Tax=Limulus polyphemus TaxID=6850 RepID=A0ABM1BYW9_LIMPO|nr:protein spaetzle-like [Limulus polyphemus]